MPRSAMPEDSTPEDAAAGRTTPTAPASGTPGDAAPLPDARGRDPVAARRRDAARWAGVGKRVGYLLFTAAIVLFFVALATGLPRGLVSAIVVCMAAGSIVLAPAIVVSYGVKAADREDRERRR